uniref:G protein gamma domain-containing protein n=1 Tax=Panagrellus redivivus TaxID=6233 RepID=A0A7E4VS72_PANRE
MKPTPQVHKATPNEMDDRQILHDRIRNQAHESLSTAILRVRKRRSPQKSVYVFDYAFAFSYVLLLIL